MGKGRARKGGRGNEQAEGEGRGIGERRAMGWEGVDGGEGDKEVISYLHYVDLQLLSFLFSFIRSITVLIRLFTYHQTVLHFCFV